MTTLPSWTQVYESVLLSCSVAVHLDVRNMLTLDSNPPHAPQPQIGQSKSCFCFSFFFCGQKEKSEIRTVNAVVCPRWRSVSLNWPNDLKERPGNKHANLVEHMEPNSMGNVCARQRRSPLPVWFPVHILFWVTTCEMHAQKLANIFIQVSNEIKLVQQTCEINKRFYDYFIPS